MWKANMDPVYVILDGTGYYVEPVAAGEPQRGFKRSNRMYTYSSKESCLAYLGWWKVYFSLVGPGGIDINDCHVCRVVFEEEELR